MPLRSIHGKRLLMSSWLRDTLGLPARKGWALELPVTDLSADGRLSGRRMNSAVFVIAFVSIRLRSFYHRVRTMSNDDSVKCDWEINLRARYIVAIKDLLKRRI